MAVPDADLVRAAQVLRNAAPAQFAEFERAFAGYADALTLGVLAPGTVDEVFRAQGIAISARLVMQLLQNVKQR